MLARSGSFHRILLGVFEPISSQTLLYTKVQSRRPWSFSLFPYGGQNKAPPSHKCTQSHTLCFSSSHTHSRRCSLAPVPVILHLTELPLFNSSPFVNAVSHPSVRAWSKESQLLCKILKHLPAKKVPPDCLAVGEFKQGQPSA